MAGFLAAQPGLLAPVAPLAPRLAAPGCGQVACSGVPGTQTAELAGAPGAGSSLTTALWGIVPGLVATAAWRRSKGRPGRRQVRAAVRAVQGDEIKFASRPDDSEQEQVLPPLPLEDRARALAESLPGLARLSGSTVVIKYGGAAMVQSPERTIRDVALLRAMGLKPVLVHGGGPEINSWLAKVGIEPKFVRGMRVTDKATMDVVAMVLMGRVNKTIVATMGAAGVRAVGLGGVDGGLLQARRVADEDLGAVGEVAGVNVDIIKAALDDGLVPVVATVAADAEGNLLNVNADIAASALAAALGSEQFVLMTDVPGLMRDVKDPESLIQELDVPSAQQLIKEGVVAGGMIPKVSCMISALEAGVEATHIIDGRRPHALLEELLGPSQGKRGTTIAKKF